MSKFLTNINLNGNELQNPVIHNLGTTPTANAKAGGIYFDTNGGLNKLKYHNGSAWVELSTGGSGTWQPADADLTAIAALTGTAGFLKTNGANTWTIDTATYLTSSTGVTTVNGSSGAISNVALTTNTLAQFAATTSAQLAGVLSDETGFSTGAKSVFNISPTITTSLITDSATFDLLNITATTINFGGAASINMGSPSGTVTIAGNLTVNGVTTTVNSSTLTVDDKNIELGSVSSGVVSTTGTIGTVSGAGPYTATITGMSATSGLVVGSVITATAGTGTFGSGVMTVASIVSNTSITVSSTLTFTAGTVTNITNTGATDATADGGGITLRGTSNKTWNWASSTSSWTSSEHIDLASGKVLKINGTQVLSAAQYTGNSSTATTATNVTGGAAGSIVYQTGSGATTTLGLGTTGYQLLAGASAPVWTKTKHSETLTTSATSYALTHGLGTADLVVSVYEVSTGEVMYADVVNTSTTTTVSFATAPTANQYRVVILA